MVTADVAGLNSFVNRHPKGFDLQVDEHGKSLSGGQRRRVGVARAVLHNAPILLMDEPTSAVNFFSEAQITTKLNAFAQDKTVVLLTHRTSLFSIVTRVNQHQPCASGRRAKHTR